MRGSRKFALSSPINPSQRLKIVNRRSGRGAVDHGMAADWGRIENQSSGEERGVWGALPVIAATRACIRWPGLLDLVD
jgi:hypothetical protein